ncbi:hypothetical protein CSW77_26115, partial [Shigella flexneri]
ESEDLSDSLRRRAAADEREQGMEAAFDELRAIAIADSTVADEHPDLHICLDQSGEDGEVGRVVHIGTALELPGDVIAHARLCRREIIAAQIGQRTVDAVQVEQIGLRGERGSV